MRERYARRRLGFGRLAGASALCLVLAAVTSGQDGPRARLGVSATPPPDNAPKQPEPLGPPSAAWPAARDDDVTANAIPINLPTALRLAQTSNLEIAQAREVVNRARAGLDRARVLLLPTINLGSTYVDHEGNIQRTEGNVIKANRDSLFVGGGPSAVVGFSEAIFTPLVAEQVLSASNAGFQRVTNDTLLAVADAYFGVLRARRRLARVDATLDFLASDRPAATRAGSKGLLAVVEAMYKAGAAEALKSEVERVRVEVLRRQEERAAAIQDLRVATAELARLVRLDPALPLWPIEDFRTPLDIPGPWFEQPVEELVRTALENRPELAENQALVQAAVERVRTARWRPVLPNLILNYNWGDFGGGPDPNPPILQGGRLVAQPGFGPSGRIRHMNTRSDFDVTLVWRLQNLGFGNRAEVRENEALARQATLRHMQVQDIVATQVVQVYEWVRGWRERVDYSRSALFDAAGKPAGPVFQSLRLNFERVRTVEKTRALEVLDSIRGLNDTLEAYGQATTDYERARFRMLIALGLSPEEILGRLTQPGP
jgi:outer membrane protein TolC